jgi:hypothetical protein
VVRLGALLDSEGRSREGFLMQVGLAYGDAKDDLADYAATCAKLGLERLVLAPPLSRRSYRERLEAEARAFGR